MACLCRKDYLLHDGLSILGVLLEVVAEGCRHGAVYSTRNLVVTEFRLGLTLELRLCNLHRDYGGETLAEVVTRDVELQFSEHATLLGVLLQCTREG